MTEHIHGCLNCRPDMVPDFTRDDPRYHGGEKCGPGIFVTVDGASTGYTKGVYEGAEGWILAASDTLDAYKIHECPNCTTRTDEGFIDHHEVCVEPVFGTVVVIHECPVRLVARAERLEALVRPLVPEETLRRARYGTEDA